MNIAGTAETVIDRVTGIHIEEQNQERILQAIEELSAMVINKEAMLSHVKKFSATKFKYKFSSIVNLEM